MTTTLAPVHADDLAAALREAVQTMAETLPYLEAEASIYDSRGPGIAGVQHDRDETQKAVTEATALLARYDEQRMAAQEATAERAILMAGYHMADARKWRAHGQFELARMYIAKAREANHRAIRLQRELRRIH